MKFFNKVTGLIFSLVCFTAPSTSIAANWHAFGMCSYLNSTNQFENFKLVSQADCRKDFYGGTGFAVAIYDWRNGNAVRVVEDYSDPDVPVRTINGVSILGQPFDLREHYNNLSLGYCYKTHDGTQYEATCFSIYGEPFQGH